MKRKLVIGSSGQIGTELVVGLKNRFGEDRVVGADIRQPNGTVKGRFEILDIMDNEALKTVVA